MLHQPVLPKTKVAIALGMALLMASGKSIADSDIEHGYTRAAASQHSVCLDFLREWKVDLPAARYQSCQKEKRPPGIVLAATYVVDGKDAEAVHKMLQARYGFGELRFICCYYNGGRGHHVDAAGREYSLSFNSDEFDGENMGVEHVTFALEIAEWIVPP